MGKSKTVQKTENRTDTSRVDPLLNDLVAKSINLRGIEEFLGPRQIADLTPDELNAFQKVRDLQGMFDTDLAQARNLFGLAGRQAEQGAPTQADLNPYLNPFIGNVLDTSIRRMNQDRDRQLLGLSSAAARTGAFGGSRQAIAEAALNSGINQNIGDLSARTYSEGYNLALNEYNNQINRRINTGNALMAGAQMGLNQKLTEAGALEGIGLTQRNRNQAGLDALFDFDRMRYEDQFRQLEGRAMGVSAFPMGVLPSTQTQTQTQKANPFNMLLGGISTIGSLFGFGSGGGGQGEQAMPMTPVGNIAAGATGGGQRMTTPWGSANPVLNAIQGSILGARQAVNTPTWLPLTSSPFSTPRPPAGFAKGGLVKRVKKFAYGGRVGNPFSMGDSNEVIKNTQNPFVGPMSQNQFGSSSMENFAGTANLDSPNDNSLRTQFPSPTTPNNVGYTPTQVPTDLNSFTNPFGPPQNPVSDLMEMVRGMRQDFMARDVGVNPQTTQGFAEGGLVDRYVKDNEERAKPRTPKIDDQARRILLGERTANEGAIWNSVDRVPEPHKGFNPNATTSQMYSTSAMQTGKGSRANNRIETDWLTGIPQAQKNTIDFLKSLGRNETTDAAPRRKRTPSVLEAVVPRKPGEPDAFTKAVAGRSGDPKVGAKVIEEAKAAEQQQNAFDTAPMNEKESGGFYNPEGGRFLGFEVANMDLLKFGLALLAGQDIGEAGLGIIAGKEEAQAAENEARAKLALEERRQAMQFQEMIMRSRIGREDALFKDAIADENRVEKAALDAAITPYQAAQLGLSQARLTLDQQRLMADLADEGNKNTKVKTPLDFMSLIDDINVEDEELGIVRKDPKKAGLLIPELKKSLAFYSEKGDGDSAAILEELLLELEDVVSGRVGSGSGMLDLSIQ